MIKKDQYKSILSEVIAKQAIILGPDIAVLKARSIKELKVDDKGGVISVSGNPDDVLQKLIDAYVGLSGEIVKSALSSILAKYSSIDKNNNNK